MWRVRLFIDSDEHPDEPRTVWRVLSAVFGWLVVVLTISVIILIVEAARDLSPGG